MKRTTKKSISSFIPNKKMIKCENCHAPISVESAKCPYCGALNFIGGEKQYMENLYDLKEEVGELGKVPVKAYRKEIGKVKKLILISLLIGIVIFALAGILYFASNHVFGYEISEEQMKEQMLWERENFPKLDALFQEEKYDEILEFMRAEENEKWAFSNWEHADFMSVYECYQNCLNSFAYYKEGGQSDEDMFWCILDVLTVIQERDYVNYNETEAELVTLYQEEAKALIYETLSIDEQKLQQLYEESCMKDEYGSYFSYKEAKKAINKYIESR